MLHNYYEVLGVGEDASEDEIKKPIDSLPIFGIQISIPLKKLFLSFKKFKKPTLRLAAPHYVEITTRH